MALDLTQGCTLLLTPDRSSRLQPSLAYAEKQDATVRLDSGTTLEFDGKIGSWHQNKFDQVQRTKGELFL